MRERFREFCFRPGWLADATRNLGHPAGRSVSFVREEMKHSWQEKLDERGLRFIDACARLRRIPPPPSTLDVRAWHGWIKQQNAILASYTDDLEPTRTLKLSAKFLRLYHRANPLTGLNEQELRLLFEQRGLPVSLADKMELEIGRASC